MRDGVSASRVAVSAGPWATVLGFLQARLPAVADWPQRLARGDVLAAAGAAVNAATPAVSGTVLWYWRSLPTEPRVPFEIAVLHHCAHLLVVDKPHFLAVAPSGRYLQETVLVRLKRELGIESLVSLHRLDRETAGVLLFAIQPPTRDAYHALWRNRQVHKVYEAVAPWRADLDLPMTAHHRLEEPPGANFMQMQVVAGVANAQTTIELIRQIEPIELTMPMASVAPSASSEPIAPLSVAAAPGLVTDQPAAAAACAWAHYRLTPHSGRRHQLRAQMNALGLPIVGDRIYPKLWPEAAPQAAPDYTQPLQLLARELAFTDPITGQQRHFVSRRRLACVP